MHEDLHEAIFRMAAALEGATDVMSRLVVAMECLKECQDDIEDDGDRESLEDADLVYPIRMKWQFYRDHLKAIVNGTEFRAALLADGYEFERNHSTFDALRKRIQEIELAKVTFKSGEGCVIMEDITFGEVAAIVYGCVIFSDIAPIAYLSFNEPQVGQGGTFTLTG
jgi:hypothetical protein